MLGNLTISFQTILLALPIIAVVNPYVTQFVKQAFAPLLKGLPNYDWDVRVLTCVMASFVGLVWLIYKGVPVTSLADVLVVIVTLIVYALLGGVTSMVTYSHLNGYLHQSPVQQVSNLKSFILRKKPVNNVTPVVVVGHSTPETPRQPY